MPMIRCDILSFVKIFLFVETKCRLSWTFAVPAHHHLMRSSKRRLLHMLFLRLLCSGRNRSFFLIWDFSCFQVYLRQSHWSKSFLAAAISRNLLAWVKRLFLPVCHLAGKHLVCFNKVFWFASRYIFWCANISLCHWSCGLSRSLISWCFNFQS